MRGMIDEYEYDEARARFLGSTWKRARIIIASVAAVVVIAMQLVTVIVSIRGGK